MTALKVGIFLILATFGMVTNAAPTVYSATDANVTSFAGMTNSAAAAAGFGTVVGAMTLVTFETALPSDLTITGGSTVTSFCGQYCGFNTTAGGQYYRLLSNNQHPDSMTFNFANPIDAFGFFVTGLQSDIFPTQKTVVLTYYGGGSITTVFPSAISGGGAFFGVVDSGQKIVGVTFNGGGDSVALDDLSFRRVTLVPEPGTFLLAGIGLAALASVRRKRQS